MVDLTNFQDGIRAAFIKYPATCHDPRAAFLDILSSAGFKPPRSLTVGRIDRIDGPEDRQGRKNGWYVYHEIPADDAVIGVASYGCWKAGFSETWCSKASHAMTESERLEFHARREAMRTEQEAERVVRSNEAAAHALEIWNASAPTTFHAYLARKRIGPNGARVAKDGRLCIPVTSGRTISSLQFIAGDGQKRFLPGGTTKGGYYRIDGTGPVVYVCEGFADAATLHEATGATAYAAFSDHNLFEVAGIAISENKNSIVIIAGDDDTATPGNPGRTKATQAAEGLGIEAIFPPGHKDFNDFACAAGLDAVREFLTPRPADETPQGATAAPEEIIRPPSGMLADIAAYYAATAGNRQPGFAIQTALAVCSIILGRSYKTSLDNYPSLYLLNVGKSGTGKEHAKTVIERILYEAGQIHLVAGDGYTSAGAVFSALLDRPRHISVIDEFGRYLEAGRDMGKGNHHQREANTKLMESIGRAHSVIRPPTYSSMTMKKDAADAIKNRQVYNPAITLLTMTTPDTLFKTLDMGAIRDGFVNRFIISISDAQREIRQHKPPVDVPERVLRWIATVTERHGKPHIAGEPASPIELEFCARALEMQQEFQQYCIDTANALERFGMAELPGRSNEMAMRISLICALARDPNAQEITASDMEWSISYIKSLLEKTISRLKISISGSDFESAKKEVLADLRARGGAGITWSEMQKNAPYSKHKTKDLREILAALRDADLACDEPFTSAKGGRPTTRWRCT